MRKALLALPLLALAAAPAHATGGFTCRTAGPRPIEVALGFGHVPGAPLFLTRLLGAGRNVPVRAPQWWLDNDELRLILTDPQSLRREAIIRARRSGFVYDGSLWRGGKRRWVRCRES